MKILLTLNCVADAVLIIMDLYSVQTMCNENIASLTNEDDRLESMIVHSPERTAREQAMMETKVCLFGRLFVNIPFCYYYN